MVSKVHRLTRSPSLNVEILLLILVDTEVLHQAIFVYKVKHQEVSVILKEQLDRINVDWRQTDT